MTSAVEAAARLRDATRPLAVPVGKAAVVLNPLDYAWEPHRMYAERYAPAGHQVQAIWMGMNPGPWGMAQTGVPFGSIPMVRDFLGIEAPVKEPTHTHPKRPILGFATERREVSGDRLWGAVQAACQTPERFFDRYYVANDCPLVWQSETGANLTPDKLPKAAMKPVLEACDQHLASLVAALRPRALIGVGVWAFKRATHVRDRFGLEIDVHRILHPSPASPAANRGWAAAATAQLEAIGHALPPR